MKQILSIQDLSFSYDKKKPVLSGVNLEIEEGSVTGILGRNGCGKSTLFNIIIGYIVSFSGEVMVGGDSVLTLSATECSKRVAYVPQNSIVNMDFTVFEYILFGRNCHVRFGAGLSESDHRQVYKYAELCGILNLLDKNINHVSGGEKQLACIARALVQESPLILMDEPMSALDFGNQARLLRMIQTLKASGKTILFTTHNPSHVIDLDCDVAIMENRGISFHGKADEIITVDMLTKIFGEEIRLFSNRIGHSL